MVAVCVEGLLVVSVYARPVPKLQEEWDTKILEVAIACGGSHPFVDWNRTPQDASIAALTEGLGAAVAEPLRPTRWEGRRTIDFFVCKQVVWEKAPECSEDINLSDHCLVRGEIRKNRCLQKTSYLLMRTQNL